MEKYEASLENTSKNKAYEVAEKLFKLNELIKSINEAYENKRETDFNNIHKSISITKKELEDSLVHLFEAHGYEASNLLVEALTPQLKVFFDVLHHPTQNVFGPNQTHLINAKKSVLDLINRLSYQNKKFKRVFETNFKKVVEELDSVDKGTADSLRDAFKRRLEEFEFERKFGYY